MNKGYPTLDLHGVSHEDGDAIIEDFILEWIEYLPIAIVTGYSEHYQKRVRTFAEKWDLSTHSQWWWNNGCLIITEKGS
jgi:hypothetical protein